MTDYNMQGNDVPNPAQPWPFCLFGKVAEEDEQAGPVARPVVVSGDDGARPEAAGHGLAGSPSFENAPNPFLEPDDGARLVVPDTGEQAQSVAWQGAASEVSHQVDDLKQPADAQEPEELRPVMPSDGGAVSHDDFPAIPTGQGAAYQTQVQDEVVDKEEDVGAVSAGDSVVGEKLSTPAQESLTSAFSVEPALPENIIAPENTVESLQAERTMKAAKSKPDQPDIIAQAETPEPEPKNTLSMVEEKPAPQKDTFQLKPKHTGLEAEPVAPPLPKPNQDQLVTVEEAVEIFQQRGLPRHMRTIQKYCAKKNGQALVCHQMPTENGIRYMIERASILRFISDAAQQTPTGKLDSEPAAQTLRQATPQPENVKPFHPSETPQMDRGKAAQNTMSDDMTIFDHPFVKRLEQQVEKLENRNEQLQTKIHNVLVDANERLTELQKASAVAQSESLGKFLLESERIRGGKVHGEGENEPVTVVNSPDAQFGQFNV